MEDSFDDSPERDVSNAASHIERMVSLLRVDGINFTGNKHLQFERLDPIESEFLHADGEAVAKEGEEPRRVAVVIGPEHGAISSFQVKTAISSASQRGYDDLVLAGFAFDAASQDKIHEENEDPASKLNVLMALIRPDVLLGDLLKGNKISDKKAETAKASQQLFTVFGQRPSISVGLDHLRLSCEIVVAILFRSRLSDVSTSPMAVEHGLKETSPSRMAAR